MVEADSMDRGTKVVLHLKQDAFEFTKESVVENLIVKYSEFINFPIFLEKKVVKKPNEADEDVEPEHPDTLKYDDDEKKKEIEIKDW